MKTEKKIKTSRLLLIVIIVFLLSLVAGFISVYFSNADLKEVIDNSIIEIIPGGTTDDEIDDEEIPDIVYPDEEEKVFVALNLDNGTEIVMYELDSGSIFNQPATPIKQGWIFDAWSSTVAYAWGTPVIENMTITALYTKLYDVTLNYNEEFWEDEARTERIEQYTIIRNDVLLLPTLPTTEEYFVFDGWLEEGTTNVFVNQAQIQRDMVLKAKFRDTRPATINPVLNYSDTTKIVTITNALEFESITLKIFNSTETQLYSLDIASFDFSSTSLTSGSYKSTATAVDEWGRETASTIMVNYVAPVEPEPTVNPVLNYDEETKTIIISNANAFASVSLTVLSPDSSVCFSGNVNSFTFLSPLPNGNYIANATVTDEWGRETTSTLNITYVKPNPAVNPVLNYNTETRIVMITNASEFESVTLEIFNVNKVKLFSVNTVSFNFLSSGAPACRYYNVIATGVDSINRITSSNLNVVYDDYNVDIVNGTLRNDMQYAITFDFSKCQNPTIGNVTHVNIQALSDDGNTVLAVRQYNVTNLPTTATMMGFNLDTAVGTYMKIYVTIYVNKGIEGQQTAYQSPAYTISYPNYPSTQFLFEVTSF